MKEAVKEQLVNLLALHGNTQVYDVFRKLGFNDVHSVVFDSIENQQKAEKWNRLQKAFVTPPDWDKIEFFAVSEINKEDFKHIKTCGWTADSDLLTFFIEKHNGEIKTLNFTRLMNALKLAELLKEKIESIKKHLENIERQQMTGKNLGGDTLTSGDFVFMANTHLSLKSKLKEWKSLLEAAKK